MKRTVTLDMLPQSRSTSLLVVSPPASSSEYLFEGVEDFGAAGMEHEVCNLVEVEAE